MSPGRPRYGFNFLWMFIWQPGRTPPPADEKALDWLAAEGFDFVRIPLDYRYWTTDFQYDRPDEAIYAHLDGYLAACRARGLHLCLNLHRAPGYCINRNDLERHNLWLDAAAQDAFVAQWAAFARRWRGIPSAELSFDLINEPPAIGQYGMTRDNHAALVRRTFAAIRAVDPQREVVIDGLDAGNLAMPELADLDVVQSGRGYLPMPVSHHLADWWSDWRTAPAPVWPGLDWQGRHWDLAALRDHFAHWVALERQGVRVHIGEFGCFKHTPNDVALRWFADLLTVYRENRWGWSLWEFSGAFGIIAHGRPGARWEERRGYQVDRDLLDLLLASRVE